MTELKIGNRLIGNNQPTYIIAEIGVNHNGSIEQAIKSIDEAKKAGADAVKFQIFQASALASDEASLVTYQKSVQKNNQKEMLEELELSNEDFLYLYQYCTQKDIDFLATPFDIESAIFLQKLGVSAFKVSSGDLTNYPLLAKLKSFQKTLLISTGMSTIAEIKDMVEKLSLKNFPYALFHCTSSYPAPFEDLHLRVIDRFREKFHTLIGYSDHSVGIEVPIAAVALGYKLIEKHFTLNKNLRGPDHKVSLEPDEFKRMTSSIRNIEKALGTPEKKVRLSELETKQFTRRSLYVTNDLQKGHTLTEDDVICLRPLAHIAATDFAKVIGKTLRKSKRKGESLQWSDFYDEVME